MIIKGVEKVNGFDILYNIMKYTVKHFNRYNLRFVERTAHFLFGYLYIFQVYDSNNKSMDVRVSLDSTDIIRAVHSSPLKIASLYVQYLFDYKYNEANLPVGFKQDLVKLVAAVIPKLDQYQ